MKDAYGNDMTADLKKAVELQKKLDKEDYSSEEERLKLIFAIRILKDDGR